MPTKPTPPAAVVLPAYQAELIAKINALPPLERARRAQAIGEFCLSLATGFADGARTEGAKA